jgi:hypothetical protein
MNRSDEQLVKGHVDAVRSGDLDVSQISHGCARTIGSWYAHGHGPTQQFATTGAITLPGDELWSALTDGGRLLQAASPDQRNALNCLGTYLSSRLAADDTGPVEGWSGMWVDTFPPAYADGAEDPCDPAA